MSKKVNRIALLTTVTESAFSAGSATAASAAAIKAACAPIGFISAGENGARKPNAATQKRIGEVRPRWTLGFVGSRLLADKPAMGEAAAMELAEAVVNGIPHKSTQTASSNVRRRTAREDSIMEQARVYWSRAQREAGIASVHPNAGNTNAEGSTKSGQGKSEAESEAKASKVTSKAEPMTVGQLWEYLAHAADTIEKVVNKANAKVCSNAQSKLANDFFIAVRAAMPANK